MTDPGITQFTRVNVSERLTVDGNEISPGGGDVNGPAASNSGALAIWDNTEGTLLRNSSILETNIIQNGSNVSLLNNDANYVTSSTPVSTFLNDANYTSSGENISVFFNDAGYITSSAPVSTFTNDANYVSSGANVSVFTNDADYTSIGSNISVFNNDVGYGLAPIESASAPVNTSVNWLNTNDNLIYFFDGSDWVSYEIFDFFFYENNNAPAGTFLFAEGNIRTDTTRGRIIPFDCKLLNYTYQQDNTNTGTVVLTGGAYGGPLAVVGNCAVGANNAGQGVVAGAVNLSALNTLSAQWVSGGNTNDMMLHIEYRKVAT